MAVGTENVALRRFSKHSREAAPVGATHVERLGRRVTMVKLEDDGIMFVALPTPSGSLDLVEAVDDRPPTSNSLLRDLGSVAFVASAVVCRNALSQIEVLRGGRSGLPPPRLRLQLDAKNRLHP
jgi:hypothetical protein